MTRPRAPWFTRFGTGMYGPADDRTHHWPDFRCPGCGVDHAAPPYYCPTCGNVFWEECHCGHSLEEGAPLATLVQPVGSQEVAP